MRHFAFGFDHLMTTRVLKLTWQTSQKLDEGKSQFSLCVKEIVLLLIPIEISRHYEIGKMEMGEMQNLSVHNAHDQLNLETQLLILIIKICTLPNSGPSIRAKSLSFLRKLKRKLFQFNMKEA